MGAIIAALGSLGIIGIETKESLGNRTLLMVLYADFYALVLALTSTAVSHLHPGRIAKTAF